ncbi:putative ATP-dependent RNA helicase [Maudiozyma humilis]|uniref:ATP-dependent RNA helicase n=1 Tax=Maudiozyma humilis TaxID=51915 RepID=A0AAV5RXH2_MAUHU|nr:putative ATP-dependent RNA helicase [Kazachstania humilis]
MFAARFDPTQVFEATEEPQAAKVVPLKRTRSTEDDSDDEEEVEETKEEEPEEEPEEVAEDTNDGESESASDEESESKSSSASASEDAAGSGDDDRHNTVMSRFHQTLSLQDKLKARGLTAEEESEKAADGSAAAEQTEETTHALEQIPQPDVVNNSEVAKSAVAESRSTAWINTKRVYYDSSMVKPFAEYKDQLTPKLLQNIQNEFSTDTFPIQSILLDTVLPVLNRSLQLTKKNLTRRVGDMLINASTGSGKTLAYSIPIIQALSGRTVSRLRVLIIVPTKLLIQQVFDTLNKLVKGTGITITTAKMDQSLREESRKLQLSEPDIFITTPGRLVDHLNSNSISLKNLKFLILDEADRLLNQSFQNWCSELMTTIQHDKLDKLPGNVVKMVFSATLTTNTQKLHDLHLYNPTLFMTDSVKLYNLPRTLQEINISLPTAKSMYKPLFLVHLLPLLESDSKLIVFVKSNEASLRLATLVNIILEKMHTKDSISVESFNSNNSRAQNRKLVSEFSTSSDGKMNVLITTDIMSRGIDISNVTAVINYDVPISSQQYVHRCGRTARAGASGQAFNYLVGKGERKFWNQQVSSAISRDVDGLEPFSWAKKSEKQDAEGDVDMDDTVDPQTIANHEKIVTVTDEEESLYKEALGELKDMVLK